MKKRQRTAIVLMLLMILSVFPAEAFGAITSSGTPTEVTTLKSSTHLKNNYVNITAGGGSLMFDCRTPVKADRYSVNVRRVTPASSKSQWICYVTPTVKRSSYYAFSGAVPASKLSNGTYVLLITMTRPGNTKSTVIYKNCNFKVKNGKFTLLQYNRIKNENARIDKAAAAAGIKKFKDPYMKDVKSIAFRNPVTKKVAPVTSSKVAYFKKVSNSVVKGADTQYEKVLKIYEYLAKNFYYDDIAFSSGTKQYVDPYLNLFNMRNKKTSANSRNGKVATVCVGYASATVALCRAQGIPARIVNGHHVGMGADRFYNWSTEKNITKVDHWWAEAYVGGRWITVDPTPGNGNRWNRTKNTWSYTGITNYIYFDPTPEQLATSHLLLSVKGA